jgi:hypothetical protein
LNYQILRKRHGKKEEDMFDGVDALSLFVGMLKLSIIVFVAVLIPILTIVDGCHEGRPTQPASTSQSHLLDWSHITAINTTELRRRPKVAGT